MWQLTSDDGTKRVFTNSATGSKCSQSFCYEDKEKNKWYEFDDLLALPYTRNFAATKITSLFALGLSKTDLDKHIEGLKTVLKSDDKEKYEKAYSIVLDFESKATNATDAIKQMTALVCVYFTINNEPIDSFEGGLQAKKMSILENDPEAHAFFLKLQIDLTESYMQRLNLIGQIASQTMGIEK